MIKDLGFTNFYVHITTTEKEKALAITRANKALAEFLKVLSVLSQKCGFVKIKSSLQELYISFDRARVLNPQSSQKSLWIEMNLHLSYPQRVPRGLSFFHASALLEMVLSSSWRDARKLCETGREFHIQIFPYCSH